MHDGQKTIHADASEEEDAAVHVGVEERDGELAQHAPKRPVLVDEVEDSERQREDKQQVGHHQVYHVGRGLVPQLQRAGEDVNGYDVSDEPHHEHNTEHSTVQRVLEAIILDAGGVVCCCFRQDGVVVHSESLSGEMRGVCYVKSL